MKNFLFANVPLSIVHFILFLLARAQGWAALRRVIAQPGGWAAGLLGASSGGVIWWAIMALNSLVWGAVLTLFVIPFIRKLLK